MSDKIRSEKEMSCSCGHRLCRCEVPCLCDESKCTCKECADAIGQNCRLCKKPLYHNKLISVELKETDVCDCFIRESNVAFARPNPYFYPICSNLPYVPYVYEEGYCVPSCNEQGCLVINRFTSYVLPNQSTASNSLNNVPNADPNNVSLLNQNCSPDSQSSQTCSCKISLSGLESQDNSSDPSRKCESVCMFSQNVNTQVESAGMVPAQVTSQCEHSVAVPAVPVMHNEATCFAPNHSDVQTKSACELSVSAMRNEQNMASSNINEKVTRVITTNGTNNLSKNSQFKETAQQGLRKKDDCIAIPLSGQRNGQVLTNSSNCFENPKRCITYNKDARVESATFYNTNFVYGEQQITGPYDDSSPLNHGGIPIKDLDEKLRSLTNKYLRKDIDCTFDRLSRELNE